MILSISMGVLSSILVAAVFGPFFLAAYAGRSNHKKMIRSVQKTAREKGLNLTRQEQWNNKLIGIDPQRGVLVFAKQSQEGSISVGQWDLSGLHGCEIRREAHTQRLNGKKVNTLDRLDLELDFGRGRDPVHLEFYRRDERFGEDLEQKRAEHWKQILMKPVRAERPQEALA